jgi:hypothetical protein
VIWGSQGDEIRVYTLDGKAFILGLLDNDKSLVILEDFTDELLRKIPEIDSTNADEEEGEEDGESRSTNSSKSIRYFGASSSANGIFDILHYL